ncbi:NADP-specific glutamate dehydrogenase [Candidatus Providencia siddallii]|uniref:Glutamate dehydrogenase n=1 Tax=Candidatus Providencia siddallii TaxID=1715285 RepID=A0A0M6W6U1_9GAMM|nr:NADP-specific glutamate dehydrogenase [Candidatus Providencia siddallii]
MEKSLSSFLEFVQMKNSSQPEFLQSIREVFTSIWPFLVKNPKYFEKSLLKRFIEPERIIQFRVSWVDDKGKVNVNRAYRVQYNSAIGPYKGGMRFHPSVNLSILKFLGFEQTLKNSLTTLPLGGGKGGSDFDPKGKSSNEVMRFCQSLITELHRHLGSDTDIPAGDIGVGCREIGFMVGMMKKLSNNTSCVFTGKELHYGGSLNRPESTGYGLVYFTDTMLKHHDLSIDGMRVAISGSGNVAQYAIKKCIELGAIVVTASDSNGTVVDENGFTFEKLACMKKIKDNYGRIEEYSKEFNLMYLANQKPWNVPVDIAFPCATQNELDIESAKMLIKNGVKVVSEGANMPTTISATELFLENGVLFAPGKAANAGGVAVSGLEMTQNSIRLSWEDEKVNSYLKRIILDIHQQCIEFSYNTKKINYIQGANIAGFTKVANAMISQGIL